jgi:hypothetical protein
MCGNCGTTQGPFYSVIDGKRACKNTKQQPDRIHECVERRAKIDANNNNVARIP